MANNGYPSLTALLGLLAVAGYQNRDKLTEWFGRRSDRGTADPSSSIDRGLSAPAGLDRVLGGLAGGTGLADIGNVISKGLQELSERLGRAGEAKTMDTWVRTGPNVPISESVLERSIGLEVLDDLAEKTGLRREEILKRLAQRLPSAVDQYTPEGRL